MPACGEGARTSEILEKSAKTSNQEEELQCAGDGEHRRERGIRLVRRALPTTREGA